MHRRFASADRLHSASSAQSESIRSPYARNYRTNMTHDQRELLSHRQNVSKLERRELEDRYIALMDHHFALKKENANNHEKIKRMATKLLRISADGKQRGAPFPMQLAPNENLEIQIVKLESYNALLKDRLNALIRRFGGGMRSASVTGMRPASCSNLSLKRKIAISQDDLHLLEIPELPDDTIKSKPPSIKCKCKSSPRQQSPGAHLSPRPQQALHREPSIAEEKSNASSVPEVTVVSASPEDKINLNDLKNTIQKLENDLCASECETKKMSKVNAALEERLTNEILSKRISENVELVELRQTVVDCGTELNELRREYMALKANTEAELDVEQRKIGELTIMVDAEALKNRLLSEELAALKTATNLIETMRDEANNSESDNGKGTKRRSIDRSPDERRELSKYNTTENTAELTRLLQESTQTIKLLRDELKTAKTAAENAQQRGSDNNRHVTPSADRVEEKTPDTHITQIPLEPNVKVAYATEKSDAAECEKIVEQNSSGSSEGGTYNVNESKPNNDTNILEMSRSRPIVSTTRTSERREKRRNRHQETASEVSSIDSDDHFKLFKKKNRNLESSLLLVSPNGVPLDLSARINVLKRVAYHQPLTTKADAGGDAAQGLTCNCSQAGCRRTSQSIYEDIHIAVENAKALLLKEFKTMSAVDPNDSNITKSMSVNGLDESSDCREFLRVQYNLNNLYKQELEMMCKSCNDQTDALMNEIDSLKEKLNQYEEKINVLESTSCDILSETEKKGPHVSSSPSGRMLCISREQGAFEIHIESFKLSKEGYSLLSCRHGEPSSLYFTWNFYSFSVESRTSLRKGPSYLFQNACIYLVDIRKIFLQYIKQKPLELNLLADDGATPMVVGRAQLNVSEVLMFPHNKIQLDTRVMSVEGECRSHMNGIQACSCQGSTTRRRYLGNLSVWFRLTCEMETLKMHSDHLWTAVDQSHSTLKRKSKATLPEHQKDSDTSSVDCGGNDGGGFSASDADETFVDRQNLRRGKQVDFKLSTLEPNEISITVGNLTLTGNSDILTKPSVKRIFIEYNFGSLVETHTVDIRKLRPKSPTSDTTIALAFNMRKVFRIDAAQNGHDRRSPQARLIKLLRNHDKNIKFLIVSEESDKKARSDGKDCVEMALGLLHLGRVVADAPSYCHRQVTQIPIMSKNHPYNSVGHLEIIVEGIGYMQQWANEKATV